MRKEMADSSMRLKITWFPQPRTMNTKKVPLLFVLVYIIFFHFIGSGFLWALYLAYDANILANNVNPFLDFMNGCIWVLLGVVAFSIPSLTRNVLNRMGYDDERLARVSYRSRFGAWFLAIPATILLFGGIMILVVAILSVL